jgi:hypothetical protein
MGWRVRGAEGRIAEQETVRVSTFCRYCAKDFEPSGYGYGRGREQLYCSLPCKQRNNMDKAQEKRAKRYHELKASGADAYMADAGSKSQVRFDAVMADLKKET